MAGVGMIETIVHWRYAPLSFTALSAVCAVLLIALAWVGIPGVDRIAGNTVQRLAKNSAAPIVGQFGNKVVDLVFAAFTLHLLGATDYGEYAVAVVAWLYLKTLSDFGLSILVTRESAREPERAGELIGSSTLLRILVLVALVPIAVGYAVGGMHAFNLSRPSAIAIGLLTLSILPGTYTEAVNSVFNARERMELPAALNVFTNLVRAALGLSALALGYGVVGLAVVSVVATSVSTLAFHVALRHLGVHPVWRLRRDQARWLLEVSWPLLLNALLLNVFFRADEFVIQAARGNHALGVYDAAYKFINTLLLVPSYFTLAAFPILTRYATGDQGRLVESYRLSVKFMTIVAWPLTLVTMTVAPILIGILGGSAFLPDSTVALRILIWFLPMSYVNAITQYVLIAVDRQRAVTTAFAAAVVFNLGANALLVPRFSFYAAAAITVATELVLLVPLMRAVKGAIGDTRLAGVVVRPALAAAAMGLVMAASWRLGPVPSAALGCLAYAPALIASGAVGRREATIVRALFGRNSALAGQL
ncbi:MAG TPA: flippase [Thermomicrobiaceae bacterium]|nr:flippase [Thermomicrobiaceae bacterium]